jgi:hypothetical protein
LLAGDNNAASFPPALLHRVKGHPVMPISKSAVAALSLVLALALGAAAEDKPYAIKLERPLAVGYQFKLTGTATMEKATVLNVGGKDQPAEEKKSTIKFEGVAQVLKVDAKGRAVEESLTVAALTQTKGQDTLDLLKKDQVVVARYADGKTTFTLKVDRPDKDKPDADKLDDDAAEALAAIVVLDADDPDQDELYGSKDARKVGESWAVNVEALRKGLKKQNMTVDAKDVTGKVTLAAQKTVDGRPQLEITGAVDVPKVEVDTETVEPGLTTEKSALRMTFRGVFPVDSALPVAAEQQAMEFTLVMSSALGKATMTGKATRDLTYTPVK